jgi:hypothetical protein
MPFLEFSMAVDGCLHLYEAGRLVQMDFLFR